MCLLTIPLMLDVPTQDCVKQVVASEGAAGLYKGMVACWAKVMPSMAIAFMTFERCKVVLEF